MVDILSDPPAPRPDHAYTVSITRLRIRRVWRAPRFFAGVGGIVGQVQAAPGMVQHGFRIRPLRLQFWTYGVFEDRASLGRFSGSDPHGPLMRRLRGRLGPLETARIELPGADLPPDWSGIADLLARHGRTAPRRSAT